MNTYTNDQITGYQPSVETVTLVCQTRILLLVGISGVGKDTIRRNLVERSGFHSIVSHTTRQPRTNHGVLEREGIEYHFISMDQAKQMVENQAFVEVKSYSGNLYGTSVNEIKLAHDSGKVAVADIEVQGVSEYKQLSQEIMAVFLLPPNYATWQQRLKQRYIDGNIDEVDLKKRIHTAYSELEHALETNYFHFVVNDDLDATLAEVEQIARQYSPAPTSIQNRQVVVDLAQAISEAIS